MFVSKNVTVYAIIDYQSFYDMLTNDIVCFEQLGPGGLKAHFKLCFISIIYFALNKSVLICFMTKSSSFFLYYMVKMR